MKTLLCLLQLTAMAHATTLIGASGDAVYRVDAKTAAISPLSDPSGATELIALTTDPRSGAVYGIDYAEPLSLVQLDADGFVASSVPITYLDFSGLLSFPSEWALSITVYVEGGSTTVIPTPGVDQDAVTPVMLVDRNTELNIDEVLALEPVQDLCGVL